MSQAAYLFATTGALAAVLAAISIWSRRPVWIKASTLAIAALFLPASYASLTSLLSRPKPVSYEWRHELADATVLASTAREGKSIYLWLKLESVDEPRAYVLPWSEEAARGLHRAGREAEANGTDVRMRGPFEPDRPDETEPLFYARPQQPLPPKAVPQVKRVVLN